MNNLTPLIKQRGLQMPELCENAKRLLLVANKLDNLPENRFDYTCWVGSSWEGLDDLSCGTTACALGWATTIQELRDLGLRLYRCDTVVGGGVVDTEKHPIELFSDPWNCAVSAAREIFGLTEKETSLLFAPDEDGRWTNSYGDSVRRDEPSAAWEPSSAENSGKLSPHATAKEVAQHIRLFVEEKVNSNDVW